MSGEIVTRGARLHNPKNITRAHPQEPARARHRAFRDVGPPTTARIGRFGAVVTNFLRRYAEHLETAV